jgi:hypothetical protein
VGESFVYFIQAGEDGAIKIGVTSDDPERRRNQLQVGNPAVLKLLGAIKGDHARERQLHRDLSEWRLEGEWFKPDPTVIAAIQQALSPPQETECTSECTSDCSHCSFCLACQKHPEIGLMFRGFAGNICERCIELGIKKIKEIRVQRDRGPI